MAKVNKKVQKKVEKYIKKLPNVTKVIAVITFLISLVGTFTVSIVLQKNDRFELIGDKVVNINVGGTYVEPNLENAIECVSFGRNVINSVAIDLDESTYDSNTSSLKEGTYYIVYKTSDFKYSSITRIRTIIVNEIDVNEDGIGD